MNDSHYDIVITGGGLVGSCLALLLRDYPGRLALVDSPADIGAVSRSDVRATALNEGSTRLLRRLGVWDALAPHASAIRRIHVSDRGHFAAARIDAADVAAPALGHVIENHRLQQVFEHALDGAPGVERVASLVGQLPPSPGTADHREVVLRDGRTLSARLIVIATGVHESVRQQLPLQTVSRDYQQTAIVTIVRAGAPQDATAYERFTPHGPVALLPMTGNRYSLVLTVAREQAAELQASSDEAFLGRLQEIFGWRLGRFHDVGARGCFDLKLVTTRSGCLPRLCLVGNALRTLHPVAGQGLNLAVRDVAELAVTLMRTAPGGDPGDGELLAAFARRRAPDQNLTTRMTDTLARVFANETAPAVFARAGGLLAIDAVPSLRRWFARQSMGLGAGSPLREPRPLA